MKEKFYITTAIAYASRKPHFGNTYEAIMTDAMYEIPSSGLTQFTVTLDYAKKKLDGANFLELKQVS